MLKQPSELMAQLLAKRLPAAIRKQLDQSEEIIAFGSRPSGLEHAESDIDIVAFADHSDRKRINGIDLVLIESGPNGRDSWLHSELASHVSKYGVWLKGEPHYLETINIGFHAISSKRQRISNFLLSLGRSWEKLHPSVRCKYQTKVRREAQRLLLLERNVSIPPTRLLDMQWSEVDHHRADVLVRLGELGDFPGNPLLSVMLSEPSRSFKTAPRPSA